MRSIGFVFVLLLALMTSAQCQQTAEGWFNEGNDFFDKGFYDLAIDCYDDAISILESKLAELWNNKGLALDAQGNYNDSIKCFDEAIRLDPNYANSWKNKGNALLALDKIDEAIKAYDEASRLDLNSTMAEHKGTNATLAKAEEMRYASEQRDWLNKSIDFNLQVKHDEAMQDYEKVIKANDEAKKAYEKAIKVDQNSQ